MKADTAGIQLNLIQQKSDRRMPREDLGKAGLTHFYLVAFVTLISHNQQERESERNRILFFSRLPSKCFYLSPFPTICDRWALYLQPTPDFTSQTPKCCIGKVESNVLCKSAAPLYILLPKWYFGPNQTILGEEMMTVLSE